MKQNEQKISVKNTLIDWYRLIPIRKRSKFILALQIKFSMSAAGVYYKIKNDNWLPYQREIINGIIKSGEWDK